MPFPTPQRLRWAPVLSLVGSRGEQGLEEFGRLEQGLGNAVALRNGVLSPVM